MQKVTTFLSLAISLMLLSACDPPPNPLLGLSDDVFDQEDSYDGPLNTVGGLSDGYVVNTTALESANNKLTTICVAAKRCEGAQ
ncbi:MAG: hypothetical protein JKY54_01915 [Flavobacteriales bacterium]|nr:hypothetical protein [Flavobacteriales bacterium]